MKLRLDEKEIAAILQDWAKLKYKTKNVSALYGVDIDETKPALQALKAVYIELEITLGDAEYTEASNQLAEEAVKNISNILKRKNAEPYPELEPDNSPKWNDSGSVI